MKNQIDRILLGVLWLLAATLISCFWFNTRYGFNLFSSAHWKYLAGLQAGQTAIQTGFYASLVICTIIALVGLYIMVRPRFRKISLARPAHTRAPAPVTPTPITTPTPHPIEQPQQSAAEVQPATTPTPTPVVEPVTKPEPEPQPATAPVAPAFGATRPMRPNVAHPKNLDTVVPPSLDTNNISTARTGTTPAPTVSKPVATTPDYPEVHEIFANAGYTVKNAPKQIEGCPITVLAIGTDEQLWLGGVGIKTTDIQRASDKLAQVFSDTLEDIYININAFVIAPLDAPTDETNILVFRDMNGLREYMSNNRNATPDADDMENFNAYSEYIDTVIEYIGKI